MNIAHTYAIAPLIVIDNYLLLVQRRNSSVWCLPSRIVMPGHSFEDTLFDELESSFKIGKTDQFKELDNYKSEIADSIVRYDIYVYRVEYTFPLELSLSGDYKKMHFYRPKDALKQNLEGLIVRDLVLREKDGTI